MFGKKIFSAITSCLLAGALLTGCGGSSDAPKPAPDDSKDVKIGMLAGLNASEQALNETMRKIEKDSGIKMVNAKYTYYDTLNAMMMGLDSKSVDEISTYTTVADYITARNDALAVNNEHKIKLEMKDKFCCAVKSDNNDLLDEIDDAIKSMKKDGTLDTLTKQYITELKADEEPAAVEMPMIDGADTVKVAVTGDLPPLDLITADGKPAGFNTAVLAEVGKRINKNIELVSVDSAARASALTSGNVDAIFWVRVPVNPDVFSSNYDCPEGVAVSDYYFVDEIVHVSKK